MPRKKSKRTGTVYFTKQTENAIVRYNKAIDNPDLREKIYKEHIEYPFDKLAENVINRFKFPYISQSFDDTKKMVVSFLVMNLSKYTQDKGKAFSYFSVIAKNFLILHNNNGYKQEKRTVYFSDKTESDLPIEDVLQLENPNHEEQDDLREFLKLEVVFWEKNLTRIFKKKRDVDVANAIVELFRRAENIENFNKKALYLMIREMTDCKTSSITKIINKMKVYFAKHWEEYQDTGIISLEESKFFTYK